VRLAALLFLATLSMLPTRGQAFPPAVDLARPFDLLNLTTVKAMWVDVGGDVYLAGERIEPLNDSTVHRIGTGLGNGSGDLIVVKMNSSFDHVFYSTLIGGSGTDTFDAMNVDGDGNVYVTGFTYSQDFPVSGRIKPELTAGTFVLKLNAAGDALIYSTLLGQGMEPLAMDVDAFGAVYIGGFAGPQELPSTPGVLWPSPVMDVNPLSHLGFLLKLDSSGSSAIFATYLDVTMDSVTALSVRPSGQIVFIASEKLGALNGTFSRLEFSIGVGRPNSMGFDATGSIYVGGAFLFDSGGTLSVQKLSPSGDRLWERGFNEGSVSFLGPPLLVSAAGRVYLFGYAFSPNFPTRNATQPCMANLKPPSGTAGIAYANPGNDLAFAVLGADGTTIHSTLTPTEVEAAALSPDGTKIYAVGTQVLRDSAFHTSTWRGMIRFDLARLPSTNHVAPSCVAHGALYGMTRPVSPGAIMTIYGSNLGPLDGTVFALDDNRAPKELAGTTVTVDGIPAPILYSQDTQINFIVPWAMRIGAVLPICVTRGADTGCLAAGTAQAAPGLFSYQDRPIAVNQDGTLNSPQNPAARGTFVSFYLTGTGTLQGPLEDGVVSGSQPQNLTATVKASFVDDGPPCTPFDPRCQSVPPIPADVQYACSAPTLVSGVTVINVRVPEKVPLGPTRYFSLGFTTSDGNSSTASGYLAVGPN